MPSLQLSAGRNLLVRRQQAAHPLRLGGHLGRHLRWLWLELGPRDLSGIALAAAAIALAAAVAAAALAAVTVTATAEPLAALAALAVTATAEPLAAVAVAAATEPLAAIAASAVPQPAAAVPKPVLPGGLPFCMHPRGLRAALAALAAAAGPAVHRGDAQAALRRRQELADRM